MAPSASHARGAFALLLASVLGACSAQGDNSATVAQLESAVIREVDFPSGGDRTVVLHLERDLTVRGPRAEDGLGFLRIRDVAVDAEGRFIVLDDEAERVFVYSADGEFLTEFGAIGEGPGEFQRPDQVAVAGQNVAVYDVARRMLVVWQRNGAFLYNATIEKPSAVRNVEGLPDGSFLISGTSVAPAAGNLGSSFAVVRVEGASAQETVVELQAHPPAVVLHDRRSYPLRGVEAATPEALVRPDGNIYLATGDTYAVHAMTPLGEPLWQLRVDSPLEPVTQAVVDLAVSRLQERGVPVDRADIVAPQHYPALDSVEVDGAGRLFVFPRRISGVEGMYAAGAAGRPFEAYSVDGRRVLAGYARVHGWQASHADYVYLIEVSEDEEEHTVARYRIIVEPLQ